MPLMTTCRHSRSPLSPCCPAPSAMTLLSHRHRLGKPYQMAPQRRDESRLRKRVETVVCDVKSGPVAHGAIRGAAPGPPTAFCDCLCATAEVDTEALDTV